MHSHQVGPHRYYTRRRVGFQGIQFEEIPLEIMGDRDGGEPPRNHGNNEDQEARDIMRNLAAG